ncbi:MAG: RsmF rRNA methyltransferase first C-terminal domain-containing protein [Clostridiales bacterium]|nr:RsmF rRNA methyltransferase first C-terminal domain-containing protein [Clostridiales bacterium]
MDKKMRERIQLPEAFEQRMKGLLGTEYEAFRQSYEQERYYGLRWNPLKTDREELMRQLPFALEQISWAGEGCYYDGSEQPGRHILHEAGVYYIQEPSAMAVAEVLNPQPGEILLDLCAAPGGKSTQIAGRMKGQGLLVSNEIIPNRAKILAQNIERMGVKNCVVCNETPERMAAFFPVFFDGIVVDAPCSGEGMFRKEPAAVAEWSPAQVQMCAERQQMILGQAAKMLKPGGRLVYSTCTFAPEENEGVISRFIETHPEFSIEKTPCDPAFEAGRPDWTKRPVEGLEHTMRLFPHKLKGEGHYIAVLRKEGSWFPTAVGGPGSAGSHDRLEETVSRFLETGLGLSGGWIGRQGGTLQRFGEQIYLTPGQMISLQGLKVVRPGLHLASDKKNRLEPAHALAMALQPQETEQRKELTREEATRYLHGESLACGEEKGWYLLTYAGYSIGFGKASGGQMKNHYPKGLRK